MTSTWRSRHRGRSWRRRRGRTARWASIGWCVDPAYAGRGLATEGATALLRICFDDLGVRRVVAGAFAANVASVRVMQKIGMRQESYGVRESLHRDLGWLDGVGYAILAEEWRVGR